MSKLQGGITMDAAQLIIEGKGYLGIEFGSTRIKAVLVDKCIGIRWTQLGKPL